MKVLSLDCETSIGKTIHGSTFRDTENDIYTIITAKHPDHVQCIHDTTGFKRSFPTNMLNDTDLVIGHNLGFDLGYMWNDEVVRNYLIAGGKIWDTQVAEYILTGQQHRFSSLAELQLKYLGKVEKPSRISYLYKKGIGADKIVQKGIKCRRLWNLYNEYCRTDGTTPLLIFKAQYARAKAEGMLEIVQLYNDYLLGLVNMECTGVQVDLVACEKTQRDFNLQHLELLQKVQELVAPMWSKKLPEYNINSPDHKSAMFFGGVLYITEKQKTGVYKNGNIRYSNVKVPVQIKGFGLNPGLSTPLKKDGVYATTDGLIQQIALESSDCKLKEYVKLQKAAMMYKKAAKTYCQAWIDRSVDGILYPSFNNTITPTGRISSSEPNLQNITKKNILAKPLWSIFVAPKGWKCVSIDFSQLEKWVQAFVSQDKVLIKNLTDGKCLHCVALAAMNKLDYNYVYQKAKVEKDPHWDKARTLIKPVSFLMDYGGGVPKVVVTTGIEREVVQSFFDKDKETYKEKHRFFDETLPNLVDATKTLSRAINIPRSLKSDNMLNNGIELLPIFDKNGNVYYNNAEFRNVGYWKTPYGKKYCFGEVGRVYKGQVQRGFEPPKFKNYPNQGGASDIQAMTTAALQEILLTKRDKIKMILEIHDSKCFYIREDVLHKALKVLKGIIEDVPKLFKERFNIDVPFKFPCEVEVGDNFGNMSKYDFNNEGIK